MRVLAKRPAAEFPKGACPGRSAPVALPALLSQVRFVVCAWRPGQCRHRTADERRGLRGDAARRIFRQSGSAGELVDDDALLAARGGPWRAVRDDFGSRPHHMP